MNMQSTTDREDDVSVGGGSAAPFSFPLVTSSVPVYDRSGYNGVLRRTKERRDLLTHIYEKCVNNEMDPGSKRMWSDMTTEELQTIVILLNDRMVQKLKKVRKTRSEKQCHLLRSLYKYVTTEPDAEHPLTGLKISERQKNIITKAYLSNLGKNDRNFPDI
jgi:hypothetical protein